MKVIQYIKINHLFNRVAFASGVILTLLATVLCLPIYSGEQETQAATGTAQESSITMNFASNTASVDLTVNNSNGTFATSSESSKAAFSITTNNYTGYTLSISASDDNGTLVNGTESLASITANKTLTDTTFNNSDYNGMWGYKPSTFLSNNTVVDNTGTNAVYLVSPTTTATTLDITNSANATAKDYSIALGARADYTKPNGSYSKTFVLTAVANKINYSVTYNKNTTDTVTNMPYSNTGNVQSGDTNSTSITLSDLVPVRDGYNFKGWCSVATSDETCSGTTYNPDGAGTNLTYGIDQTTLNIGTLYAMWQSAETKCDGTKLCVQYEGNGLTYDGKTVNRVNYNSSTSQQEMTKYSHTSNISDAGVNSGSYSSNLATKDVISIPGASELNVTITYGTENNWDMLYVFQGEYTGTISRNMDQASTGWLYKYMGGNNTTTTVTITIPGDTATFGFYSDGSGNYYGYYAIISGTGTTIERTVASGEYATPTGTNAIFHGWSSTQTTAGAGLPSSVEYTDESEVLSKMPGNEGESKILYAVWQQPYSITFNKDSNVSSIAVLDSDGDTVGTITSSGQSLILYQGDTYTIKPTHATGYTTNTITKTSGAGTLNGKEFTVGAGTATISVTSKPLEPIQNWTGCSSLAVGDTEQVYDTRDNEVYLVGKLADNKCWLLDNLRLDLTNENIRNALTASNTNATETSLTSLRSGNRTAGAQYASSGFATWAVGDTVNAYNQAKANADYKDTTTTGYGSGSGKIGVYYNYCAASAGSYCYDDGAAPDGTNASQDICPAGWRMPTGGSSGEYQALYTAYSSNDTDFRNALSTPLSGYFYNGSAYGQGSYGLFWSSARLNGSYMYYLDVGSSGVYPQSGSYRYHGRSVRCLLDERNELYP